MAYVYGLVYVCRVAYVYGVGYIDRFALAHQAVFVCEVTTDHAVVEVSILTQTFDLEWLRPIEYTSNPFQWKAIPLTSRLALSEGGTLDQLFYSGTRKFNP